MKFLFLWLAVLASPLFQTALAEDRPGVGVCEGEIPFYRAYRHDISDHLYSTSLAEIRSAAVQGYRYEGVAFYAFATAIDGGMAAVARLYNPNNGGHYLTANENEWRTLVSWGWRLEGLEGYLFQQEVPFSVQVYRLYNRGTGKHLYTQDENEVNALVNGGWEMHAPLGWVPDCGFVF